jgi:hypothetical protein
MHFMVSSGNNEKKKWNGGSQGPKQFSAAQTESHLSYMGRIYSRDSAPSVVNMVANTLMPRQILNILFNNICCAIMNRLFTWTTIIMLQCVCVCVCVCLCVSVCVCVCVCVVRVRDRDRGRETERESKGEWVYKSSLCPPGTVSLNESVCLLSQ